MIYFNLSLPTLAGQRLTIFFKGHLPWNASTTSAIKGYQPSTRPEEGLKSEYSSDSEGYTVFNPLSGLVVGAMRKCQKTAGPTVFDQKLREPYAPPSIPSLSSD